MSKCRHRCASEMLYSLLHSSGLPLLQRSFLSLAFCSGKIKMTQMQRATPIIQCIPLLISQFLCICKHYLVTLALSRFSRIYYLIPVWLLVFAVKVVKFFFQTYELLKTLRFTNEKEKR